MKLLKKKRFIIPAAVAVVLIAGGAAFAYFTSAGGGTGSAPVGIAKNVTIAQLGGTPIYDSTISPLPGNIPSYGPEAYAYNEIGNEIDLAPTSLPLSNVVVTLSSWPCESASGTTSCTTTPGATFPVPITLNIYGASTSGVPGSLIATDTQTFNVPYRPSGSLNCPVMYGHNQWYDAANGKCYNGLATNVTFNFSPQDIVLPSDIVYGISFNTDHYGPQPTGGSSNPTDSLNIAFTTASLNLSVGSDVHAGNIFINDGYATNGNIFCGTITADTFMEAYNDCSSVSGSPAMYDIPAVQFNTGGMADLYPGSSQPISFSITNPGGGNEYVNNVTILVSSVSQTAAGVLAGPCNPGWFTVSPNPVVVAAELAPGTTDYWNVTNIAMIDEPFPQDGCQGATVNLAFTSN